MASRRAASGGRWHHAWEARDRVYRRRFHELAPDGLDVVIFAGRGYYGWYYGTLQNGRLG